MMEREKSSSNGASKRKTVSKSNGPQFTIPRLKKLKRDLLTDLSLDSHECQNDILAPVRKSFHFQTSYASHEFLRVQSVHNPGQVAKYLERRKDMKSNGYSDSLVSDTIAFVPVESVSQIEQLCKDGIKCGNQKLSGLGVPHMAIHVCKHADIITPIKSKAGERALVVVKVIKGKVKTVLCRGVGCELEPTPNYDCHVAKSNLDQQAAQSPHLQFYSSQLYLYEYGDFDVEEYPRQVLPFAVIYYSIREPQQIIPKAINSSPHLAQTALPSSMLVSGPDTSWHGQQAGGHGPSNEVWRGRLHVRLVEGGHIYIEVSLLSYYVPLTVNILSPIKIHGLFPEHNAQFTFLNGLSNLAEQVEVEWRAHYFRSYVMRPRPNNEGHFKALVKHISAKREMPTVRLPNDVFLFLMPNCLLASQLGLVRREDNTPVLHCVLMSKFSTSEAEKKKLAAKRRPLPKFGSATSWEELFDDSDHSDEESPETTLAHTSKTQASLAQNLSAMFKDQCSIQNKFACMSLADAEANLSRCSCRSLGDAKAYKQTCRDTDIQRILSTLQSVTQPSQKPTVKSYFPAGSRRKPRAKVSHRTRNMPSFSPHGSSESESDSENSHRSSRKVKGHLSMLHSTKTVEEELSEEELTNEQMEDIIFMRKKPAQASGASGSSRVKQEAVSSPRVAKQPQPKEPTVVVPKPKSQVSPLSPVAPIPNQQFDTDFYNRDNKEPLFSSKPKIIPMEPIEDPNITPTGSPGSARIPQSPSLQSSPLCTNPNDVTSGEWSAPSLQSSPLCTNPNDITSGEWSAPGEAPETTKPVQISKKHSSPSAGRKDPLVKSSLKVNSTETSVSTMPSLLKITKQHEPLISLSASTPNVTGELSVSRRVSSVADRQKMGSRDSIKSSSSAPPSSLSSAPLLSLSSAPPSSLPSSMQSEAKLSLQEELDFGDVDMRVPSHRSSSLNPVFLTADGEDMSSPLRVEHPSERLPNSHNLSFGMWLAPSDIVAPLQPPPFPAKFLVEAAESPPLPTPKSPSPPLPTPKSSSPPCSPISLPDNSPPSPTDSPASPPTESPASPPSPATPAEIPTESPASPPSPLTPAEIPTESPASPPSPSACAEIPTESPASPLTPAEIPTESPASPPSPSAHAEIPTESPASPPSPATPAELDLESPMSPRSTTFSVLRSTPIAIPTNRLEQQTASPEINYLQWRSPFASRSLTAQVFPTAMTSCSGIDNADDMKDFLNGGFNSDLDSSYEDER